MKKYHLTGLIAGIFSLTIGITAFAGVWQRDEIGWWYENEDGTWLDNGWAWIDGNGDGISECYYFNQEGYCLINTFTPDGYMVDINGARLNHSGYVEVQTSERTHVTNQMTADDAMLLLREYYQKDPSKPFIEATDTQNAFFCSFNAYCGVPGNPTAIQRLYEIEVNLENGDVREKNIISGITTYFNLIKYFNLIN